MKKEEIRALTTRTGNVVPSQINTPEGVAYGKPATIKLTAGPTYEESHIRTNVPAAAIEKIEVILNGDSDIVIAGEVLEMFEKYKKHAGSGVAVDGTFTYVIPFSDLCGRTIEAQSVSAFVTLSSDNVFLKVHFRPKSAEPTPDAWPSVIELDGTNYTSPGKPARLFRNIVRTITTPNMSTGEVTFLDLPKDGYIRRAHIKGDVSKVELKKDGKTHFEQSKAQNDFELRRSGVLGKAPQAGYYHLDFIKHDFNISDLYNPMNVSREQELIMQLDTAGSVPIIIEMLKPV